MITEKEIVDILKTKFQNQMDYKGLITATSREVFYKEDADDFYKKIAEEIKNNILAKITLTDLIQLLGKHITKTPNNYEVIYREYFVDVAEDIKKFLIEKIK